MKGGGLGNTECSKEEKSKEQSWEAAGNVQKFKEETKNGLDCENAERLKNLKLKHM